MRLILQRVVEAEIELPSISIDDAIEPIETVAETETNFQIGTLLPEETSTGQIDDNEHSDVPPSATQEMILCHDEDTPTALDIHLDEPRR